jgi:tetrahydromethanopterin S-methyltransferase subunit G
MDVTEVQKRKDELESKIRTMLTDFITQTGINIIGIDIEITRAVFGDASRINSFLIETSI